MKIRKLVIVFLTSIVLLLTACGGGGGGGDSETTNTTTATVEATPLIFQAKNTAGESIMMVMTDEFGMVIFYDGSGGGFDPLRLSVFAQDGARADFSFVSGQLVNQTKQIATYSTRSFINNCDDPNSIGRWVDNVLVGFQEWADEESALASIAFRSISLGGYWCPSQTHINLAEEQLQDITGLDLGLARNIINYGDWNCETSILRCIIEAVRANGEDFGFMNGLDMTGIDSEPPVTSLDPQNFVYVADSGPIPMTDVTGFTATPTSGVAPLFVTFSADALNLDGRGLAHEWSVDSDNYFEPLTFNSGYEANREFTDPGTYIITLSVRYHRGGGFIGSSSQTITVTAVENPPVNFTPSLANNIAPYSVLLSADNALGNITSFTWTSSDGQSKQGAQASMAFATEGQYTITLDVLYNDGTTGQSSQTISISGGTLEIGTQTGTDFWRRVDTGTTVLALDSSGQNTYSCSWADCGGANTVCGVKVDGSYTETSVTLEIPNNSGGTAPYAFDRISTGTDTMSLYLNGAGAGDYQKMSFANATSGSNGVCDFSGVVSGPNTGEANDDVIVMTGNVKIDHNGSITDNGIKLDLDVLANDSAGLELVSVSSDTVRLQNLRISSDKSKIVYTLPMNFGRIVWDSSPGWQLPETDPVIFNLNYTAKRVLADGSEEFSSATASVNINLSEIDITFHTVHEALYTTQFIIPLAQISQGGAAYLAPHGDASKYRGYINKAPAIYGKSTYVMGDLVFYVGWEDEPIIDSDGYSFQEASTCKTYEIPYENWERHGVMSVYRYSWHVPNPTYGTLPCQLSGRFTYDNGVRISEEIIYYN